MDQHSAPHEQDQATPIFGAFRRGYDPDQVDRYVADQQRRLDESTTRASEAERRLAAAVGQLRELHRRVAVLESEDRSPQAPALDTLGERVQRILQEAWEGAYALRQNAEQEVVDLRSSAAVEADTILESARTKARAMDEETERRRRVFLERVEEDRNRAVAQISYLHEQRKIALGELIKVKDVIEATIGEASALPGFGRAAERAGGTGGASPTRAALEDQPSFPKVRPEASGPLHRGHDEPFASASPAAEPALEVDSRPTLPVQHLGMLTDRRHQDEDNSVPYGPDEEHSLLTGGGAEAPHEDTVQGHDDHVGVFDFDQEQP